MAKKKVIEKLKNDPLMPLRHSAEHVLQTAMQELYPKLKLVMGPPIKDGFYMDFDLDEKISPEDFPKIEKRMQEIIDAKMGLNMIEASLEEAKEIFKDNPYKIDTLSEIEDKDEKITLCELGEKGGKHYDLDLCAGNHVKNTKDVKAFKLTTVAGAYYKGDENKQMLQRIYGTAFKNKEDLNAHLEMLEELKKRDHRKLGKELDLFTFNDEVGPGLPLWTPNGTVIREELEEWAKETEKEWGYVRVVSPHIAKHTLYETSGHLPHYRDSMYSPMDIDGEEYFLKGMNCPHHHMIFKSTPKSYRDLPLRYAEYGTVYRYEKSGSLFGLMRVRSIAQNDAHIYCSLEDAEKEFLDALKLHEYYYNTLGLTKDDYYLVIGLPDEDEREKYHGDKEMWDKAEEMMRNAIRKSGIKVEEDVGGAAFYGPKIDFNVISSIGREFSISTNQLDLYMPERFGLEYTDKDGSKKPLAVIHRAPLGSHERFVGFLIEHFGGAFPVWLAPVQAVIIPISEKHHDYANKVAEKMLEAGLRVEIDDKDGSMGSKIRDAQLKKVPYMMVVGDKEVNDETVSIRLRTNENLGAQKLDETVEKIKEIYLARKLELW